MVKRLISMFSHRNIDQLEIPSFLLYSVRHDENIIAGDTHKLNMPYTQIVESAGFDEDMHGFF
jgi:hypothetical protein